jgi:hypothetical protein
MPFAFFGWGTVRVERTPARKRFAFSISPQGGRSDEVNDKT